ncbi:arylsulfatase B [Urbifossiella limnaea]|uniref:Arylsulfatase n=1 Tax=Urbifossiella limnaea TaxID=2528023 RepID=A0A517XPK7_9BACT|nr:arylsulfatase [Urbifossiella limnaea]QDU19424.1 Arylsulfatase [Urbifossiella limnaea]
MLKRPNLVAGALVALVATLGWAVGTDRVSLRFARAAAAAALTEQPVAVPPRAPAVRPGSAANSVALHNQQVAAVAQKDGKQPNIVVILADDLGNADLGYRGSRIRTPHIDALAKGGVRLESYYGLPVCTPARAALLTGRYPMRHGLQTLVIFPSHRYGLPTDERTLPLALREAGYKTYMVGKWHLGHADRKFWPQSRGFDHFYGNVMGEVDYFTRDRGGVVDWQRNGTFLREEGYYTNLIGNEAVDLIRRHDTSKPMFLYFASLAAHAPYQAPKEDIDAYRDVFPDEQHRTYAAMITGLDAQVGRVVAELERRGMRENTLIFFTTDNGGATSALFATGARSPAEREASGGVALGNLPPCSNGPFRGGKGSLYEGGVRLPAFYNWPARLKPAVVNEPLHHVDLMPTLLAQAGGRGSPAHPFDGRDATATIAEGRPSPHDDILINVEAFRGAIRKGKWKLVKVAVLPGRTELYDLSIDPGEKQNVADQNPAVVADLEARLVAYARQQKPSEWLRSQVDFLGFQGETVLDPGYNIDRGLPTEAPALPK